MRCGIGLRWSGCNDAGKTLWFCRQSRVSERSQHPVSPPITPDGSVTGVLSFIARNSGLVPCPTDRHASHVATATSASRVWRPTVKGNPNLSAARCKSNQSCK